ncbi:MAG: trehalose-phosphatase, partial [Mycolicibacterium sp.]
MTLPITLDARYHHGVVFDLDSAGIDEAEIDGAGIDDATIVGSAVVLARKLHVAGIATAACYTRPQFRQELERAGRDEVFDLCVDGTGHATAAVAEAIHGLGIRPQRGVVLERSAAGVATARNAGFALIVGVGTGERARELSDGGADVVVADLADLTVRMGDARISDLPNALSSYGQLIGVAGTRESILFLDYDGTLSPIVSDPAAANLVDGAAEALALAAKTSAVAILSGRDLKDVRERVNIPGLWYAGSHGFELCGPDGAVRQNERAARFIPVLERAAAELARNLAGVNGVRVEHKRFAVAVHYREVSAERVGEVVAAAHSLGAREGLRVTGGRMIVELRPDIDWDKGTTLAWIRDRIDPSGSMLPIYIGDDLTDEDAFDAVRLDGIGIVVTHDEDGDRRSAARFTLRSPRQVCEFIARGSRWLTYNQQVSDKAWEYVFDGYDPQAEKLREALCTAGNGYFATRGAAPESKAGQVHYPGTYAAGVFNRLVDNVSGTEVDHESLVNLPNWLALTFRIDGGPWYDTDKVTVLSYRQTFDLRAAVLTRQVRFTDDAGRTSSLTQRRFVAMHMPHVGALETTVRAENWSGTIEFRSMLDGNVTNSLVERYRDLANQHLGPVDTRVIDDESVLLTTQTTQSRIPIAMAARNTVWRDGEPVPATFNLHDQHREIGHDIGVRISIGERVTVEKVVTVYTGRDVATSEPSVTAARWVTRLGRFEELLAGHRAEWMHLWERLSIEFDDFGEELRTLRLHLLHLLQTVSPNTDDLDAGVPARGLHGEAYRGHIFWDELFIFPVLNLRLPMVTRSLLRYRYRRLDEARSAARAAGHRGAMYPWQSGSDGREESPVLHLNPRSGRWNPDASARAHHIGIAVAYNAWKFYQVTGDLAYLIDYGAEMLVEIARFFVSLASYDEGRTRFDIRGVIGPDEFHSGYPDAPYDGVDNNAYTNVMAVWVIVRAFEALSLLPLPNRLDLRETIGLTSAELAHWDEVSRRMYIPFHDGVISQFE